MFIFLLTIFDIIYVINSITNIVTIVFKSLILSIKLLPIYAQKLIINILPIVRATRYFFLFILDTPDKIFIKKDGVNGNAIMAASVGSDILLNFLIPKFTFSFIFLLNILLYNFSVIFENTE